MVDCKTSRVNGATGKTERIILPRSTDAIRDALELASASLDLGPNPEKCEERVALDLSDAVFLLPLHFSEMA